MADLARQVHQMEDVSPAIVPSGEGQLAAVPAQSRRSGVADVLGEPAPAGSAFQVPEPYESVAELSEPLTGQERHHLQACETALNVLRIAFAQAGKALQTIRDARLYREEYSTFEDYCEAKWQISRPHAYRLIQAWPIAEAVSPIGDTVNEGQVRELVPIATRHGQQAAVTVYRTVAELDGGRMTAALLRRAVAALPMNHWDEDLAVRLIQAQLADDPDEEVVDPAEVFTAEAERLRATVTRTVSRPAFRAYARQHPEQARAVIMGLRKMLDEIEAETRGS